MLPPSQRSLASEMSRTAGEKTWHRAALLADKCANEDGWPADSEKYRKPNQNMLQNFHALDVA